MNLLKSITSGLCILGIMLLTNCNNNSQESSSNSNEVEGVDPTRYNINAPDEEVIKLDSTRVDSTSSTE